MKKIFLGLISLAAIAVGCEYEVIEGERLETQKMVPITVNVPSNQSRVAYDGANATFEIGDQIALRVHDIANDEKLAAEQTAYTFTCTAVAGDGNATFEGELPAYATNVQIGANYPSTLESYTGEKWCRVKTPIPTSFTQTADGSIVEAYDYLRAEATATSIEEGTEITLTFNHVMAFLDFKITNNTGNAVTLNGVELSCTENLFWNGENSRIHTYATGNDSWIEASNGTAAQIETYLATPVTLAAGESKNIVIATTSNDMSAKALNITVVCAEGEQSFAKPNGPNMGMGSYATSNLSLTSIESIETTNLAEISASVYTEDVNSSAWIHVLDAEVPASVATTLGYADNAALFAALGGDVAYTIKDAYDNKVSTPKADAWFDATGKFDQANGVWGTLTQAEGSTGLRVAFFRRDISTVTAAELTFTATFEKDNKVVNLPLRITVADKPDIDFTLKNTYNIELSMDAPGANINGIVIPNDIIANIQTDLGISSLSDELTATTVTFYGINSDGSEFTGGIATTNGPYGHWYNTDENVISWGTPDPNGTGATRYAYLEGHPITGFKLGLEATNFSVGDSFTLRTAYAKGTDMVCVNYVVTVEEAPVLDVTLKNTYEVELSMYAPGATINGVVIPDDIIANIQTDLGISSLSDELTAESVTYYGINSDGSVYPGGIKTSNGPYGHWYNTDENAIEWGTPDPNGTGATRFAFLEGHPITGFNLGIATPNFSVGDSFTLRTAYVKGSNMVRVDYVVNITEAPEFDIVRTYQKSYSVVNPGGYSTPEPIFSLEDIMPEIQTLIGGAPDKILMSNSESEFQLWNSTDGWFGANGAAGWGTQAQMFCLKPNADGTFEYCAAINNGECNAQCTYRYINSATSKAVDVEITIALTAPIVAD